MIDKYVQSLGTLGDREFNLILVQISVRTLLCPRPSNYFTYILSLTPPLTEHHKHGASLKKQPALITYQGRIKEHAEFRCL